MHTGLVEIISENCRRRTVATGRDLQSFIILLCAGCPKMSSGKPESKGERIGEDHGIRSRKSEDDPTRLRAEKFMAQAAAVMQSSTTPAPADELPDYIEIVSQIADDNVFEPYFMTHSGPFERNLYANMSDLKSIRKVDNLLRVTKVTAIVSCFFSFGLCLRSCTQLNPFFAVLYGIIAADSLRVSYNCYIKNYCAIALKNLGADGNPAKIGAAVFQW